VRVAVVGSSGSGKTTFGRALASRLRVPFIELDSIFHQAGWTPLDTEEFRRRVGSIVAGEAWVVDGNYGAVRPLVLERATTVVWLDHSRPIVMWRVIRRSIGRAVSRRELWNGNREDPRTWLEREHPIRWSWSNFSRKRQEYGARFDSPQYGHLEVRRFRKPREARDWLATIRHGGWS
jgi:adenylate kinase family enzyme